MPNQNTNNGQNANQNTNTNNNQNGGNNMNNQNQTPQIPQIPQGVDPTMYMMMMMQQQSQENMMLMLQQMNQNNPNAALIQMLSSNNNNQNNNNNQQLSPLGQRLNDVTTFANMITPSTDELTTAGDRAVTKAEAEYNAAFTAVQALNPQATQAQIENVLKTFGKVPLTQEQQDAIRAKAEEELINRKTESFNKAVTGLAAFESTYATPAPATVAVTPIPPAPSQKKTFAEFLGDCAKANAQATIVKVDTILGKK